MRTPIGNQGEIRIDRIESLPEFTTAPFKEKKGDHFIISHSEQGHHHLLGGDVEVMERMESVPAGAKILYAIVKEPTKLWQDATVPHEPIPLDPGIYEFRIKREYDPFSEQARRVTD